MEDRGMTADERRDYAQTMFEQNPELFPQDRRTNILNGVVTLGMTPFEARLAGGAFSYKVIADATRWSKHSDPLEVMWAQSMQSDDSEIWMFFRNKTQIGTQQEISFRVYFQHGRATSIEKLKD
jgi:hypothetical protein